MNFIFAWSTRYPVEWAQRTSEILSLTREDKIHIHRRVCNTFCLLYKHQWNTKTAWFRTSFIGSLFSASLGRWHRDFGCSWSRDHLSIKNRRVCVYSSTFAVAPPFQQIFLPPRFCVVTWPAATRSLFQRLKDVEKRDPGNEVACFERRDLLCNHNDGDLFTCEDMKFPRESSLGISLLFR